MLFGKNRDSEIGLWLPNCTRCARTILLTTANFRTHFFPNSTTDPPITYTNYSAGKCAGWLQASPSTEDCKLVVRLQMQNTLGIVVMGQLDE